MRVLLLSISPDHSGNRQRTEYLADALRLVGHKPYIVKWKGWTQFSIKEEPRTNDTVSIQLLPTAGRLFSQKIPFWNQLLVWKKIKAVVRKLGIDVVICPNNWYVIGYPPRKFEVPILIDYFDLLEDDMEEHYLSKHRVALCTSIELQSRAKRWTDNAFWIPTPIDVSRFNYSRIAAKKLLGISSDTVVISLIGLTASPKLYFIDAIDRLEIDNVKCLLIGGGELAEPMLRKIEQARHHDRFQMLGKIPYSEIPKYFCASDIGLYPGDNEEYYHTACPIKVLEYTAAGATVISNELRELKNWEFPNVHLVPPTADEFRKALEKVVNTQGALGDLAKFTLESVSRGMNQVLSIV